MQISVIVALTLLVLTAFGFLIGRRRALAARGASSGRLHSLPNYYGYYIALWTGGPALVVLALYGAMGAGLVNTLAMTQLEREAAPLIAEFDRQLANDAAYGDLLAQAADAESDAMEAREAIALARDAGLDPEDFQIELARQTTRLTEIGAQRDVRRGEIVRDVAGGGGRAKTRTPPHAKL
jgi:phosphate transport system permease protein